MNYADLVRLFFERSNALQWYWTLYVIVIGGLLAFASQRQRRDRLTTLLVTILFAFFAYKNLGAIVETSLQRIAVLEQIKATPIDGTGLDPEGIRQRNSQRQALESTMVTPDVGGLRIFHFASDVLTIGALWAMERRRRLMAEETVGRIG